MNWTEEQLAAHYERLKGGDANCDPETGHTDRHCNAAPSKTSGGAHPRSDPDAMPKSHKAKLPRRGIKNGWESLYAKELEVQRRAGLIQWFGFESLRLRLANDCYYCPDFIVQLASGKIQAIEIKGHVRAASMVRFKVAVEVFPWIEFQMISKASKANGGGWERIK